MKQVVMYHSEWESATYERETVDEVMDALTTFVTKNENGVDCDIGEITVHQDRKSELWYGTVYYQVRKRVRL